MKLTNLYCKFYHVCLFCVAIAALKCNNRWVSSFGAWMALLWNLIEFAVGNQMQ